MIDREVFFNINGTVFNSREARKEALLNPTVDNVKEALQESAKFELEAASLIRKLRVVCDSLGENISAERAKEINDFLKGCLR